MALNWADLWAQDASEMDVPQDERDEIIEEVLTEIGKKMKRRNKVNEMTTFKTKKVQQNLALVEYP